MNEKSSNNRTAAVTVGFVFVVIALCILTAGAVLLAEFIVSDSSDVDGAPDKKHYCIVIDAGHGGIDSGAVGVNGAFEKNINLSVATKLAELCKLSGVDYIMTRDSDVMLVDDSVKTHRKMHDLKNRVAAANSVGGDVIFVSIHMNNFTEKRYSGLQVWYSKNDERSSSLAAYVQTYARTYLDRSNERETKKAGSSIYVLDNIKLPAVLVECGFMSNPDECAKLCTDEYQTELAVTIFASLLAYMNGGR